MEATTTIKRASGDRRRGASPSVHLYAVEVQYPNGWTREGPELKDHESASMWAQALARVGGLSGRVVTVWRA